MFTVMHGTADQRIISQGLGYTSTFKRAMCNRRNQTPHLIGARICDGFALTSKAPDLTRDLARPTCDLLLPPLNSPNSLDGSGERHRCLDHRSRVY